MQLLIVRFNDYKLGIDTTNLLTVTRDCSVTPIPCSNKLILGTTLYDNDTKGVINMNAWLDIHDGSPIVSYVICKQIVLPVNEVCGVINIQQEDLIPANSFIDPKHEGLITAILPYNGDLCFAINLKQLQERLNKVEEDVQLNG